MTFPDQASIELDLPSNEPLSGKSVESVAAGLRLRAIQAQRGALAAFALTAVVVGGGAVGFYLAGNLVQKESKVVVDELQAKVNAMAATSTSSLDSVKTTVDDLSKTAQDLRAVAADVAQSNSAAPRLPSNATDSEKNVQTLLETKTRAQLVLDGADETLSKSRITVETTQMQLKNAAKDYAAALKLSPDLDQEKIVAHAKSNTAGYGALVVAALHRSEIANESVAKAATGHTEAEQALDRADDAIRDASERLLRTQSQSRASLGIALREYTAASDVKSKLVRSLEQRAEGIADLRLEASDLGKKVQTAGEDLKTQIARLQTPVQPIDGFYLWGVGLLTRSAVALFTFFAAQMLLGLYRYNMRLAGHLHARADALSLVTADSFGNERQKYLHAFIEAMSPDRVDFGRAPMNPAEKVLELAKDVATGLARTKS